MAPNYFRKTFLGSKTSKVLRKDANLKKSRELIFDCKVSKVKTLTKKKKKKKRQKRKRIWNLE